MIKKATIKDINALVNLNKEVQTLHHKAFPKKFKPYSETGILKEIRGILKDKKMNILIAFDDCKKPNGYIIFEKRKYEETGFTFSHKVLYIHHISIEKNSQNKGIGKRLIQEVINRAKSLNINRIELDVWSFNVQARSIFKKLGFDVYNEKMALAILRISKS